MKPNPSQSRGVSFQDQPQTSMCSEGDKELEHQAASLSTWEVLSAVLIATIIFNGGLNLFFIPGVLLFMWAAISKHGSDMSNLKGEKRKREEDLNITDESENHVLKRQRENLQIISQKDIESSNQENDSNFTPPRSISDVKAEETEGNDELVGEGDGIDDETEDDEKDVEESPQDFGEFQPLLKSILLDKLPELASKLRYQFDIGMTQKPNQQLDIKPIDCVVNEKFLYGSYNILWRIEFSDGLIWLIKVPVIGTIDKFDELAAKTLENEFRTMRFLKTNTTIPLPEVYAYDKSFDNIINCPYILMEYIPSTNLYLVWFNESASASAAELEEYRARSLKDIVAAMSQLDQFKCSEGGALLFDNNGKPIGAGTMRVVDDAEYLLAEGAEEYGKVHELGPYSDPVAMATRYLDLHEKPTNDRSSAIEALTRLFLSWVPQGSNPKFVLTHPDFGIQNFLVGEDGSLLSIIDWDGVCFQPRFIGSESFPTWLTTDWNPEYYKRDPEFDRSAVRQNTLEELARYRAMYVNFMEESKTVAEASSSPSMTKISLLTYNLATAASQSYHWGAREILIKVMHEISEALPDDPRKFRSEYEEDCELLEEEIDPAKTDEELMMDIGMAVDAGTLSEERMGWLRDSFAALCAKLEE